MGAFRPGLLLLLSLCAGGRTESELVPVEPGDTIVLPCPGPEGPAEGADGADYWVLPEGIQIPVPSSSGNYVTNATTLIIRDVEESHAGRYQCHRQGAAADQLAAVRLAVRARPYWQKHGTSLTLAVVAAGCFLLIGAAICLVHRYRYERRHKNDADMRRSVLSEAHTNPALDVKDETHL